MRKIRKFGITAGSVVLLFVAWSLLSQRETQSDATSTFSDLAKEGLFLGDFRLARKAVLDGDTIRVVGLPKTLRLIGVDTEETFKNVRDRYEAERDFEAYLKAKRGESPKPVKAATPLGEEAKRFAQDFFKGVDIVRLERDHPEEIRCRYGRFLAYVFAYKDGRWLNYNIEVVRAGMSPYFTKYGYSRRFHEDFVRAEAEARAAKRGIWDPTKKHYRDYDERKRWWNKRADFLKEIEAEGEGRRDFVLLSRWNAMDRLQRLVGREAVVVGEVGEIVKKDRVILVKLGSRKGEDFPLVFFDYEVFAKSNIERYQGEYVRAQGKVRVYRNPRNNEETLEMVIERPENIRGSIEGFGETED